MLAYALFVETKIKVTDGRLYIAYPTLGIGVFHTQSSIADLPRL